MLGTEFFFEMLLSKLHRFSYFYQRPLLFLFSAFIYKQNNNNVHLLIQEVTVDNTTSVKFEKKNNTENFVYQVLQWARNSK